MGALGSVAIAVAERVERTGGARAGLAAWRKLAETSGDAEVRGHAILAAMRCAVTVRDLHALTTLPRLWETVDVGVWDAQLFALCKQMARESLRVPMTELAASEVRRLRSARGLYLYARCLDVAGDPRAAAAFAEARERALREGRGDLAHASEVRRVVWLARVPETTLDAIAAAKELDLTRLAPAEKLAIARVLCASGSRFVRGNGLGLLDDLVSSTSRAPEAERLRSAALILAARHADDVGDALTALEIDRLLAIFAREPVKATAARAREALLAATRLSAAKDDASFDAALDEAARALPELAPIHRRAREILAGRFEAHDAPLGGSRAPWSLLLDAVVALRDQKLARGASALRSLSEACERGERIPKAAFTVAETALAIDDLEVRGVAGRLLVALMVKGTAAPPRGWLALATTLAAHGMESSADTARRNAAVAKEPGAEAALALALTRSGWRLAREGDRARALARLREAKKLAQPTEPRSTASTVSPPRRS